MDYTQAMKEWLLDCFCDDYDQEQIKDLTVNELIRAINKYFDGGYKTFILTMET